MSRFDTDNVMRREEALWRFGAAVGPCPFCGSDHVGLHMGRLPHVTCMSCGADGPLCGRDDRESQQYRAIQLWNARPAGPDPGPRRRR